MLDWAGIDQQMKMGESSRAIDKKLSGNNNRKARRGLQHSFVWLDVFFSLRQKYVLLLQQDRRLMRFC